MLAAASGLLGIAAVLLSGQPAQSPSERAASLRSAVQAEHRQAWDDVRSFGDGSGTIRYAHAFADLNGDGSDEAVVQVMGPLICGSGGCPLFIYARRGDSWRQISRISIANAPIRLLNTRSRGWRDLGVLARGGGIRRAFEARLRFDGRRYASNPSTAPAAPRGAPGRILIPADAEGTSLF